MGRNKEKHKEWQKKNRNRLNEYLKKWRLDNKDKQKEYGKKWYKQNRNEKIAKNIKYNRIKKQTNKLYKLSCNIRTLMANAFKRGKINKNSKTQTILGCSFEEFKQYLESQFESWMNWNNGPKPYLENERTWQIDHKIPVSFAKTEEEIIRLNHYSNLRPYCAKANIEEGNRR